MHERTAELTAANERLRDSEQRYRSVVEDHLEFIIRWNGDGVRTFVNESYCRYLNSDRQQLIGSSFMASIVEEDREGHAPPVALDGADDAVPLERGAVHDQRAPARL